MLSQPPDRIGGDPCICFMPVGDDVEGPRPCRGHNPTVDAHFLEEIGKRDYPLHALHEEPQILQNQWRGLVEGLEQGTHIALQRLDPRLTLSDKKDIVNNPSGWKTIYDVGIGHGHPRHWHDTVRETDIG